MREEIIRALAVFDNLRITEAHDGLDGMRKLLGHRFDIILTDLNMPIMDGLKLVKRVRMDAHHKDVPIIVITTQSAAEDRARAMQLGATAYLLKPINGAEVAEKVRELLGMTVHD